MTIFDIIAILITLTALFSFINHRYLKLPTTIGVMLMGLVVSVDIVILDYLGLPVAREAEHLLRQVDFNETLMHGMLSYLLFAGALHVNLSDLAQQKWLIATLATVGVVLSTALIAGGMWCVLKLLGLELPFIYCLIFGALISPTDPIAVLAILKSVGASKSLETKITGESLFNDGVGVVVFMLLFGIAFSGGFTGGHDVTVTPQSIAKLFAEEAAGGLLFGLALGGVAYWMLKRVDNYQVEVLITLAVVTGGYTFAESLHVSAPIAIVVAGLMIGNQGRVFAMSETTQEHLDNFWELLDEILNAILFVLIGLEVIIISLEPLHMAAGLAAIVIVLLARFISVSLPVSLMRPFRSFSPGVIKILTWSGLRGGISIALALSLPNGAERELILTITYCVVIFSILVQGLTIGKLIQRNAE